MRLLVAEDDEALAKFLQRGLESDGHRVQHAENGATALEAFREVLPDLTILDLGLPVMDGQSTLSAMRRVDSQLPILILTGQQAIDTRIRCLDLGADDFMLKPFSLHELRARCRALLRRKREAKLLLRAGDLELDRLDRTARRGGELVALTNKEFALMEHLMLRRGQCVSRVELLDAVWNMEPALTTNIVDVYVNYLRRKLKDSPPGHLLRTVRGQGYTRAGQFHLNNQGTIVTTDGDPLLPTITIPANATSVTITQYGVVNASLPGQTNPAQLGQIQLATFANPGGLESMGGNLLKATFSSGDAVLGNPGGTEGLGTLQQGYLENSNVDVVTEFVQMVLAQRAYESNSKVIKAADDMYSQVNNMTR